MQIVGREASSDSSWSFDQLYTPTRREEQRSHFTAMASALYQRLAVHGLSCLADSVAAITTTTLVEEQRNRRYRFLCRLGALDPSFPQDQLFDKAQQAVSAPTLEAGCIALGIVPSSDSHRLIQAYHEQESMIEALALPTALGRAKESLTSSLLQLEQLLSSAPKATEDLEDRNHALLSNLRDIYASPLYTALCMSNLPLIDILHAIAIGQYTDTALAPAFEPLSHQLNQRQHPLSERVNTIWQRLARTGINDGLFSAVLHYSRRLLFTIALPYIALKIAQFLSLHWLIPHIGDERSILRNTPGALCDEIQTNDILHRRTIRTVVLPAPTLGYEIAPEFRAALQALENNQFSTYDTPYLTWAYTNLQNVAFPPEYSSTVALMDLRTLYPLSFQTMTLPQNLPNAPMPTFSRDDVVHHLALLQRPASGYCFPPHFIDSYHQRIAAIADDAYHLVDSHREGHSPEALKSAYARLFHLGLTRLHEATAFTLTATRTHSLALSAIRSTICASCIDRGGMMNAATIYALSGNADLATGAYFGRALLSHHRAPTRQSAYNLSTLFAIIPQPAVKEYLLRSSLHQTSLVAT